MPFKKKFIITGASQSVKFHFRFSSSKQNNRLCIDTKKKKKARKRSWQPSPMPREIEEDAMGGPYKPPRLDQAPSPQ